MNRGRYTEGGGLLARVVLFLTLLSVAISPASAEGILDVAAVRGSVDATSYLRTLTTDQAQVIVDLPPSGNDKAETINLQAKGAAAPYQWKILALVNASATPRQLVLAVDFQNFSGSGLFTPLTPGSVVMSGVQAGSNAVANASGLGQDALEITLGPAQSAAFAIETLTSSPAVTLWDRDAYDRNMRSLAFFRGALLGINLLLIATVLLLLASRVKAQLLSGAVLVTAATCFMAFEAGYLSTELRLFGLFRLRPAETRAIIEATMAIGLLLCLASTPEFRRSMPRMWNGALLISALGLALPAYAFIDPYAVSMISRLAFGATAFAGAALLYVLRQRPMARSTVLQWSGAAAWTVLAAVAMFTEGGAFSLLPLLLVSLTGVMVLFVYNYTKAVAGEGLLSQRVFQEAGRRGLALAGAQQYVWDWHPRERHLFVSEELEKALGHPPGILRNAGSDALLELMHPSDRLSYLGALENTERRGRGFIGRELRLQRGDGSYRWFELRARGMAGPDNRLVRAIGTLADVTHTKRAEERLLKDAVYDQVTGLPNRALLLDRLTREIDGHRVENLYILLIDIDRFKAVNDALGHEVGDGLLNVAGRRISAMVEPEDTVARLPGDQFAILIPNANPNRNIARFADVVRTAIAQPINMRPREVFLTASIGVARYRQLGLTAEQFLKDSAIALYEAKRRGNESIQFFQTSMRDDRGELVALEGELRRALERNEIEVHYQPIARLRDMDLAGFEALVRWRHPVLGLLAPEAFLGIAEQTGLIKDIGRYVLNEATRQLGIWQRAFRPTDPIFMAVNVSSSQLLESDLVSDVGAAIIREAVYRHTLKIEVTESVVMQYPEKAAGVLERIKQLGVGLACDDFGTGYSSLASLRSLPFDTLKVDKSFISPDPDDDRAAIILEAIIALAHDLGLTIVAEGIEDQGQVDRLGGLICDYGQGFFIGQPMSAKQVSETLGSLPYAPARDRTVISTLWETSHVAPEAIVTQPGLSTSAIERAQTEKAHEQRLEQVTTLAMSDGSSEVTPRPGGSPMAPRLVYPPPVRAWKPEEEAENSTVPLKRQKPAAPRKKTARKAKSKRKVAQVRPMADEAL
jgi:diguanylate cyclase (GGDEF)-like protein/PAS domain S-box-containing protein